MASAASDANVVVYPDGRQELRDAFIRVYLGIQPSACPSHRRGAKIEQNVFLLGSRVIQRRIYVFSPCNGHWLTSCHELR